MVNKVLPEVVAIATLPRRILLLKIVKSSKCINEPRAQILKAKLPPRLSNLFHIYWSRTATVFQYDQPQQMEHLTSTTLWNYAPVYYISPTIRPTRAPKRNFLCKTLWDIISFWMHKANVEHKSLRDCHLCTQDGSQMKHIGKLQLLTAAEALEFMAIDIYWDSYPKPCRVPKRGYYDWLLFFNSSVQFPLRKLYRRTLRLYFLTIGFSYIVFQTRYWLINAPSLSANPCGHFAFSYG